MMPENKYSRNTKPSNSSISEKKLHKITPMRCFPLPEGKTNHAEFVKLHPIYDWMSKYNYSSYLLNSRQELALAKLIPLLLCGEQSAVFVFSAEQSRIKSFGSLPQIDSSVLLDAAERQLQKIELDEHVHEQALQLLLSQLPKAPQQHKIKRLAQRFYTKLQQCSHSPSEHFKMIAQLDSCVCILMNAVANSSVKHTPLAELFNLIKKDEARHVSIAKKHSLLLSTFEKASESDSAFNIQFNLVDMLMTQQQAFEDLDIDTTQLFSRLLKSSPL